jgi:hypothetical protein
MAIRLDDALTNNAGWLRTFSFTASYDGGESFSPIDFTGAQIKIEVDDQNGRNRITATVDNGKITILDDGRFELNVPAIQMAGLCAGSYPIGGVYQINGSEPISLFTGTLAMKNGVARL